MSLIDRANDLIRQIRDEQLSNCGPQAAREFAIAITAVEDAAMRCVRGLALKQNRVSTAEMAVDTLPPQTGNDLTKQTGNDLSKGRQMTVDEVIALTPLRDEKDLAESA